MRAARLPPHNNHSQHYQHGSLHSPTDQDSVQPCLRQVVREECRRRDNRPRRSLGAHEYPQLALFKGCNQRPSDRYDFLYQGTPVRGQERQD